MNTIQNRHLTVIILGGSRRSPLVVAAEEPAPCAVLNAGDNRLEPDETLSIARRGQTLCIVSGCAWVTLDGQDTTLLAGEEMILNPGKDAAVVSALEEQAVIYRLCETSGC